MKCKAGFYYSRPFTSPAAISGLVSWFDASDQSTLFNSRDSGSLVAPDGMTRRFENKASNRHFRDNSSAGPTLRTGVRNGLDALEFNGTSNFMYLADPSSTSSATSLANLVNSSRSTVFVVANALSAPNDSTDGRLNARPFGSQNHSFFGVRSSGSANASASTLVSSSFVTVTSSVPYVVGEWAVFCAQHDGTSLTARINGVDGTSASFSSRGYYGGDFGKLSPSEIAGQDHFNGYIGEIVTYNVSLSTENRDAVEKYLRDKWGFA